MEKKEITPKLIIQRIKEHKKLFSITLAVTFVLSCILILCVPRSYSSSIMLAPEINADPGGTIGSIAANFGIDLNDMQTTDAITPLLYPDLADDNRFICSLFNVKVKSADGTVNCTYYEYLLNHQKHAWWSPIFKWFNKLIKSIMPAEKDFGGKQEESTFNGEKYVWVCDPIDGTGMFQAEVPVCVFSLALVEDGVVIVGVVVDPFLNKTYSAIRGKGAFCNGKRLHVNSLKFGDLGYRLNYEMWGSSSYQTMGFAMKHLDDVKVSSIGSVARSCMAIASGKFSCDLFPGEEHGNCDIAAASLIVEEAGGFVSNFYGEKDRMDQPIHGAILSNGVSHQKILELIRQDKDFFK